MRARLTKDFTFEAAQTLPNVPPGHKCRRMHGHSFKVEVSIEGEVDPHLGWIYDHSCISRAMEPLLEMMDHAYLNDIEGLENPTIENMAAWLWKRLDAGCPGLCEIVIHETPTARCVYREGEFAPLSFVDTYLLTPSNVSLRSQRWRVRPPPDAGRALQAGRKSARMLLHENHP